MLHSDRQRYCPRICATRISAGWTYRYRWFFKAKRPASYCPRNCARAMRISADNAIGLSSSGTFYTAASALAAAWRRYQVRRLMPSAFQGSSRLSETLREVMPFARRRSASLNRLRSFRRRWRSRLLISQAPMVRIRRNWRVVAVRPSSLPSSSALHRRGFAIASLSSGSSSHSGSQGALAAAHFLASLSAECPGPVAKWWSMISRSARPASSSGRIGPYRSANRRSISARRNIAMFLDPRLRLASQA
jgi:hypothetical protein